MTMPYLPRLFCLSLALFFLLHLVIAVFIGASASTILRFAERLRPQLAARFLLLVRLLPSGLAALLVIVIGVPSFLRFEPRDLAEPVGFLCLAAAALGVSIWIVSFWRAAHALLTSLRYVRECERAGCWAQVPCASSPALLLEMNAPLLLIAGVFRPRLVVSTGLLAALSAAEWAAALRHERAHCISRDNLKRLLLIAAPRMFPWSRAWRELDRAWVQFAEWAADDYASCAEPNGSLHLAEGLIRLARLGSSVSLPLLATPLLAAGSDLTVRIERLLRKEQNPQTTAPFRMTPVFLICIATIALALNQHILAGVHAALEILIR